MEDIDAYSGGHNNKQQRIGGVGGFETLHFLPIGTGEILRRIKDTHGPGWENCIMYTAMRRRYQIFASKVTRPSWTGVQSGGVY